MKKLRQWVKTAAVRGLTALPVAARVVCTALCLGLALGAQAETVSYLEPVFDSKGAVSGYTTKTANCTVLPTLDKCVTLNAGWYVTGSDNVSGTGCWGSYINRTLVINGNVHIVLRDGKGLWVNMDLEKHGGLRVEEGSSLTIYAQSTSENSIGKMWAYGGKYSSAIGSGSKDGITSGAITINGGVVEATGGSYGAGIGGGKYGKGTGITINGGIVTATGGEKGAGIGGGEKAYGTYITINGGKVTTNGGELGAGIGGGNQGHGEYITINGGTVTAAGGRCAAGIGGCTDYTSGTSGCENITINDGTVTARGGIYGAGIGGCSYSVGTGITIVGGVVTATGGGSAAGIGGGVNKSGERITISGGTVTATGGRWAAGIGGGERANGERITINGGSVTATGGETGAGIGGGGYSDGVDISITGGRVTAVGGGRDESSSCHDGRGASIGGGGYYYVIFSRSDCAGDAKNITISGGTIVAKNWPIGGGEKGGLEDGGNCTNLRITGGSINGDLQITPVNAAGQNVVKTTVVGVDESPAELTGLSNYGVNDLYPDNGTLYFYLPSGSYTFYSGTKKYSGNAGSTIKGTTFYGVSVNATDIGKGSGTGWTFDAASHTLTLSSARTYNLSGTDKVGNICVKVTANADVTLDNLTLPLTKQNGWPIEFTAGTTSSLILKGVNTVYGQGTYSAVLARTGAKVTVSGTGELVGNHANSRGLQTEGGTLVMESGTIRDYSVENGGGGVYCRGTFTMNGGTISGCSTSNGGAIYNEGTVTINGGTISGCSASIFGGAIYNEGSQTINGGTISGCSAYCGGALFNDGTANIYGGTFTGNSAANFGGFCYCNKDRTVSIYGGYFANNTAPEGRCNLYVSYNYEQNGRLYGGVFAANPLSDAESRGCLVLQSIEQGTVAVTKVGNFYVVGTDVQSQNGKLTAGAYTFYPKNLEYENAGLKVLDNCTVTEQSTTPKTYLVKNYADFRINGAAIGTGSGEGWSFDATAGLLTLSSEMDYTLSGACDEALKVDVTAKADITLSDVRIHSGDLGRAIFDIQAADTTLTLGGSNEVYTTDGNAAFGIASGASLTLNAGDGALWGGAAASANGRCVTVADGGAFTMNGGEIRGYSAATDGSVIVSAGAATIYGGTIAGNGGTSLLSGAVAVRGGVFTDNGSTTLTSETGIVYGGVYDVEPAATAIVSGSAATKVGDRYVVGQGVTEVDGQLTGGTYTFNPEAAEYAAAGITCAAHYSAVPQGTTPETYTVHAEAEFQVNGVSVETGSGEGWSFVTEGTAGRLTLSKPMDYTLTGYADLTLTVDVLSNATVTLDGIRIKADKPSRDIFRVFGDDTTFVLSGTNTVYANDGNAAIGVTAGSRLKVAGCRLNGGDGDCLVGGRTSGINGRGFSVVGELVLESGAIRDYYAGGGGGVFCDGGTFTMNGGEIAGCSSYLTGSGTSIFGGGIFFNNNANGNLNGGTISGCSAMYGSAFASMWATVNVRSGFVVSNNVATGHGTCFAQRAKINIWGGTYRNNRSNSGVFVSSYHASTVNVYGGVVTDNIGLLFKKNETSVLNVHGGVYSSEPDSEWIVSGSKAEQVGDLWVVGTGVQSDAGKLSYGTYTFDPQEAEYAAVGLGIAARHIVTAQGTTPETYLVDWNYTGLKIGYQDDDGNIVDDKDVIVGSGNGWSFDEASGIVTINAVRHEEYDDVPHVLSGQNTRKDIDLHVTINAAASVILSNVTIATTANVPLTANAAGVKILLAGENTLTAPDQKAGLACPEGKDVTIDLADADADDASAVLNVQGGYYSSAIGNCWYQKTGAITIDGGTINATAGADGAAIGSARDAGCAGVTINGGIVNATASGYAAAIGAGFRTSCDFVRITGGRVTTTSSGDQIGIGYRRDSHNWSSCPTVTIEGGTVVAETIQANTSVTITGGSVKAACTPNPKNGDGDTVWCVTFPDVTDDYVTDWYLDGYDYGTADIYPISGELYAWMPSRDDTYEYMYVNDHLENDEYYYADVHDAPTIAYHKYEGIELYVNGEQVTEEGGTGWTYEDIGDYPEDWVLTLSPSADTTNSYVITGEAMEGRVRIVVAGDCDVTFSGRLGGGNPDDYKADNLIAISAGTTVNLTLASTAFFKPYDGYAPIAVQDGATLNLVDAGAMSDLKIDFPGEGTGKVVTADPTTLTFTSEESAKAAAATVTPVANTEDFPSINTPEAQAAYATRVTAVAVETSPGTWTLEYQISEQGTNDIVMVISSVEAASNLVENITLGTPTATIVPVPGFYYGLPGATEVENVEGATPPTWYAGQEDEALEVKGSTFINADKAFYQLRATLKP